MLRHTGFRLQGQAPAVCAVMCRRRQHQLIHAGRGGRCSVDGATITVFGATGQAGRYLVNELGKKGTQMVIPYRGDEMHWRHLRPMADVGQITFMEYDIRDYNKVREAVEYSDIVFNLVGRDYPTRNFSFTDVHVQGARNIARACRDAGVGRLVHVSALGAASNSPSAFLRSKAAGEAAVREEYPDATIVRPAELFGPEDKLLNKITERMKLLGGIFLIDPNTVKYPVFAPDVGRGLAACAVDERAPGTTYEFFGPEQFTMQELAEYIIKTVKMPKTRIYRIPTPIAMTYGYIQEKNPLYAPLTTRDQIIRETLSETPAGLPGLLDLGVKPTTVETVAIQFLRRFRKHIFHDEHLEDEDLAHRASRARATA